MIFFNWGQKKGKEEIDFNVQFNFWLNIQLFHNTLKQKMSNYCIWALQTHCYDIGESILPLWAILPDFNKPHWPARWLFQEPSNRDQYREDALLLMILNDTTNEELIIGKQYQPLYKLYSN